MFSQRYAFLHEGGAIFLEIAFFLCGFGAINRICMGKNNLDKGKTVIANNFAVRNDGFAGLILFLRCYFERITKQCSA